MNECIKEKEVLTEIIVTSATLGASLNHIKLCISI